MFYTPKPRQFHYTPRLYDPEKEEWEKLKTKYRLERGLPLDDEARKIVAEENDQTPETNDSQDVTTPRKEYSKTAEIDDELAYFQRKVKELDAEKRRESNKLTLNDLFRKREKPQFHYVSRFDENGNLKEEVDPRSNDNTVPKRRISRRFEDGEDDRFKPVPAGKIMISVLAVALLLLWIFW